LMSLYLIRLLVIYAIFSNPSVLQRKKYDIMYEFRYASLCTYILKRTPLLEK